MGKKTLPTKAPRIIYPKLVEWLQGQSIEWLDDDLAKARAHSVDGAELRRRIDAFGLSYVKVAPWLGLTVEGLHKQMRGERAVSLQTILLLQQIETMLDDTRELSAKELAHPATPQFLRKMAKKHRRLIVD